MARDKDKEAGMEFDEQINEGDYGNLDDVLKKNPNEGQNGKPSPETVEGLAKRLEVSAPVFAAVMQMQGWVSGKTVGEDEFKKAVEAFLGAPISGVKPLKGEKK